MNMKFVNERSQMLLFQQEKGLCLESPSQQVQSTLSKSFRSLDIEDPVESEPGVIVDLPQRSQKNQARILQSPQDINKQWFSPKQEWLKLKVKKTTQSVPLMGWILLLVTLISDSAVAPFAKSLQYPPLLLNAWRRSCSAAMFFPFAALSLTNPDMRKKLFTVEALKPVALSLLGMTICNQFFYLSMLYLAPPLATMFLNISPLFLVVAKLGKGRQISYLEVFGTMFALGGAAIVGISQLDGIEAVKTGTTDFNKGTVFAVIGALGLAIYLEYGKDMRSFMTIPTFHFVFNVTSFFITVAVEIALYKPDFEPYDSLPTKSIFGTLFGYLLVPRLFLLQVAVSFILDVIALQGTLAVLKYFEALLVSVVLLASPIVVILLDLVLRVSDPPDATTLFGCAVVMVGCALVVVYSNADQPQQVEVTQFNGSTLLQQQAAKLTDSKHHELNLKEVSYESYQ
mmetsp:Transcript_19009/g.24558  ORF Transcript_19009/g.24558 Transcript_19009/m.24558 type:complete len:456 (+) Transcript_19009:379-1746(+)